MKRKAKLETFTMPESLCLHLGGPIVESNLAYATFISPSAQILPFNDDGILRSIRYIYINIYVYSATY